MSRGLSFAMLALASVCQSAWAADEPFLHAPSVDTYAKHDPAGRTILSNGRFLQPVGKHLPVGQFPYGLAMSRDGKTLFVPVETLRKGRVYEFRIDGPKSRDGESLLHAEAYYTLNYLVK